MEINNFIKKRPYLFHLTSKDNIKNIISTKKLYSTKCIVETTECPEPNKILKEKRMEHKIIKHNDITYMLRDQKPISEKLLKGCLEEGMTFEQYYEMLNERVFWWPTIDRLTRHYSRYESEKPKIIRVSTESVYKLNKSKIEFSHLNSGALRANPYLKGKSPKRGYNTFVIPSKFNYSTSKVAEVTFLWDCLLPDEIYISNSPNGNWKKEIM